VAAANAGNECFHGGWPSESVTRAKSCDEDAEERPYFSDQARPCCPECGHDHGLAFHPPRIRHHQRGGDKALGLRVGRSPPSHADRAVAHRKNRVRQTQGMGEERTFHRWRSRSCSSPKSVAPAPIPPVGPPGSAPQHRYRLGERPTGRPRRYPKRRLSSGAGRAGGSSHSQQVPLNTKRPAQWPRRVSVRQVPPPASHLTERTPSGSRLRAGRHERWLLTGAGGG